MKNPLFRWLLLCAIGCAPDSPPELSDAKFIDLLADAEALHRRYPHAPDSLLAKREALFKRHGIVRADIERFLNDRRDRPEKWDALIALIQRRFGERSESQVKAVERISPRDSEGRAGRREARGTDERR